MDKNSEVMGENSKIFLVSLKNPCPKGKVSVQWLCQLDIVK